MIRTKLILHHFIISIVSFGILSLITNFANDGLFDLGNLFGMIYFAINLSSYFISGYISTEKIEKTISYFWVFIIGSILWLFCFLKFISYSGQEQYKFDIWYLYEFYILPKSSLNIVSFKNIQIETFTGLFLILTYPFLFSLFQYFGGKFKLNQIEQRSANRGHVQRL